MARLGMAFLGLVLAATAARAQMLGDVGAAMAVHGAAAGTAAPSAAAVTGSVRAKLANSGNPTGSTCPIRILSDYANRVAGEQAAKSAPKGAWAAAGELGGGGGKSQSWENAGSAGRGGPSNNAWAKNDKGTHAAPRRR